MKKVVLGLAAVAAFPLVAGQIAWTGGGSTYAWSDGGNWDGGTAPGKGDIAVIPAGATVGMTQADVNYVVAKDTKLGGIHFAGDDSVLLVTNLTAQTDFNIPFTGGGECRMLNNNNPYYIKMLADNSSYHGSFMISNSAAYLGCSTGMGTTNVVTYWGNATAVKYFGIGSGISCANEFRLYGTQYLINGGNAPTFLGPIRIWGTTQLATSGTASMSFYGGITYEGTFTGNYGVSFVGRMFFRGKPVDFGARWINGNSAGNFNNGGTWTIDTDVNAAVVAPPSDSSALGPGRIVFERANCLTPKTGLLLGRANGDSTSVDLGGYDQRCGELSIGKNGAMNPRCTYITSASDATFTILTKGPTQFNGLINDKASLELNSTNSATAGSIGLCGTNNTTTGALIARRGTINVLPVAVFSNLTAIVASGDGVIDVQSAATFAALKTMSVTGRGEVRMCAGSLNEDMTELEVSGSGKVVLGGGTYRFKSIKIGNTQLFAGDYAVGDAALGGAFEGAGDIHVFKGPVGSILIVM